ncbi:Pyridoxamine 5'-phosphate oxidase [Halomicronema hongdechloris C2206]|uniref:Pyridoxamine 5'-phosphate oxidase n=1 Tax=Halomicronema hongdechloris C2206 TaxID=1641165 RepID=A0A1Z3HIM1_9CYAN|nr:pyridoxamine 5'-phosphate oxidase family protein [Halomicronema hongdechloris]ASC70145.1 Pyridoxamine 5'-phosphate oxidase [Halomicronema hongdechloris C2206]
MAPSQQVLTAYRQFPTTVSSLLLSTVDGEGQPHGSYAPFVMGPQREFYIFVSGLASHTRHLAETQRAAILLIEDEAQCSQIFARKQLTYRCTATFVDRHGACWQQLIDQFQQRFGDIIATLKSLADFQLVQLTPYEGRFVTGFGAAYDVDPNDLNGLKPNRR